MSGRVVHFEVPYDDAERARSFYGGVFGWRIQPTQMQYDLVSTGPVDAAGRPSAPGYVGGGMTQRGGHVTQPVITIEVDDVRATLDRIRSNGGAGLGEPFTVGEMGIAAYFTDSEGNSMGLWQSTA